MKFQTFKRMFSYILITFVISFLTQLENFEFDVMSLGLKDIITISIKSLIPCLISVKAFFDQSVSTQENE